MGSYVMFAERDTVLKNPKYQILSNRAGSCYFRLCARNGEIVLTSVGFQTKSDCLEALTQMRDEGDFNFVETQDNKRKLFSFSVRANNHRELGRSENYTTKLGRGNGIMSVMKIICDAPTEDLIQ